MQHIETLEAKRLSGNSGYDVVVPSDSFLAKQIDEQSSNVSTGREASAMTGSLKYSGSLDA
ncbi:hypothetical protein PS861_03996 [Pseudomonas fluorescens]|nr:hypothetical protein PS861_03996 [Pseudomonas fluorescens]